jgi:hypothetical protein
MRRLGSVTISNARGYFSSVWIDDNRLVAVIGHPDGLQAVLIDVTQQRVLETTKLPDAHAIAVAGAPGGVAILLSRHGIGPMRVAVISGRHHWIRTVRRIQGGSAPTATPVQTQQIHPALVVDRSTSRAFVVGAGPEPLAQIDLRTGALTYKRLSEELGRPSFRSDYVERFAIAASAGKLVVSGWDDWTASNDGTGWRPVGAAMIDTLSGAVKVIDARAVSAWNTGSAIVTADLSGSFEVFSPSGRLQFPLLQPPRNSGNIPRACTNGRYLYVAEEASGGLLIFDLTNGALLGGMPLEAFINVVLSSGDVGNAAVNPWQC